MLRQREMWSKMSEVCQTFSLQYSFPINFANSPIPWTDKNICQNHQDQMIKHFNVSFIIKTSKSVLCKNWRTYDSIWLGIFCFKMFGVGLREIFALTRLTQPHNCALVFLHKWTYCVSASGGIQKVVHLVFCKLR